MAITILDYVKFEIGEQDCYTAEDFHATGSSPDPGPRRLTATTTKGVHPCLVLQTRPLAASSSPVFVT